MYLSGEAGAFSASPLSQEHWDTHILGPPRDMTLKFVSSAILLHYIHTSESRATSPSRYHLTIENFFHFSTYAESQIRSSTGKLWTFPLVCMEICAPVHNRSTFMANTDKISTTTRISQKQYRKNKTSRLGH